MRNYFLLLACAVLFQFSSAQSVGIGTTAPNSKAILDVKATDKGILFPRLTNAQRDAIVNPPNGLHIFNTDQRCLNYYDSVFQIWNCYCVDDTCKVATILIGNGCGVDFYNTYGKNYPNAKKMSVVIPLGVTICDGLNFATIPVSSTVNIKIVNYGTILGTGGMGGSGASGQVGGPCYANATAGAAGGAAISTRAGLTLTIDNFGLIAGGGGGGGGGGGTTPGQLGGGGGGGAGTNPGNAGIGGGGTISNPFGGGCGTIQSGTNPNGTIGTATTGGSGGTGLTGGGNGGIGGGRAQAGSAGTGTNPGAGGAPGKAVNGGGGTGNIVINHGTGQVLGIVD